MVNKILLLLLLFSALSSAQTTESYFSKTDLNASPVISVTIGGAFPVNGSFPASSTERVDQFVTRIFNTSKTQALAQTKDQNQSNALNYKFDNYAKRGILLKRSNGKSELLDLDKFRITGNFIYNPYLKNDDVIIFPDMDLDRNFFSISGAVNNPGKFQFIDGDKLSDALLLAHGLNKAYEGIIKTEIHRLSYDGARQEIVSVKAGENLVLQRGDRIVIAADETQKKDFVAYLTGEVKTPGYFPITKNNTTIREIIQAAGGITGNADLNRGELIRGANVFKSPMFSEALEGMLMQRVSNIDSEDSLSFAIDNRLRFSRGNGTIDFTKVLDPASEEGNFIVKDGDYIVIPEKLNLVYVYGQVLNPGYVKYMEGKDHTYYIAKAGGTSKTAKNETFLIKGKTRSWIQFTDDTKPNIEPGDYIWVPKKPMHDFNFYLSRVGSIASVVGAMATIVVLLVQVIK